VRIALVTTPWSSRSGIADYTRHLLPYLREGADVDLYVEPGREGEECAGEELRSVAELEPREVDRILYQLGNEAQHAFMVPLVKNLGGTVMLHDWVLFDLAMAAYPELGRGGLRGLRRAFCEGGAEEARVYLRNKRGPAAVQTGWHAHEADGRWCAASATIPVDGADRLRWSVHLPAGRRLVMRRGAVELGEWRGDVEGELELASGDAEPVELAVHGTRAARAEGDGRTLGAFFRELEVRVDGTWREPALAVVATMGETGLSADRFALTLNRSIVRHADAFLVHSDWVGERILASRNAPTPISRVHHGVERRWSDAPAAELRAALGLPPSWRDAFLLATFGAVQAHKRPQVLLDALAVLEGGDLDARLLWVGEERPQEFDILGEARRRGLSERVHVTGWLPEAEAWRALEAADVGVQLRGPSTGGTSGGASQFLSVGRPVIVSKLPELTHLPSSLWVPQGEDEVRDLAQLVFGLDEDASSHRDLAANIRRTVDEKLHWSHAAQRYLDVLESHPHARASRRSLIVRFFQATARHEGSAGEEELTGAGKA
jgi:glycosyltransferase involved in cell wall biosynthesis